MHGSKKERKTSKEKSSATNPNSASYSDKKLLSDDEILNDVIEIGQELGLDKALVTDSDTDINAQFGKTVMMHARTQGVIGEVLAEAQLEKKTGDNTTSMHFSHSHSMK